MKKTLQISDSLALAAAYATSRNMVLAQSGAGKSNVCVVLAEEMHRVGIPWVTIDTKGDWYGIRSNRTGKQRGLDVPVFGGEFGDMPLSPRAGARMAELVAAGKFAGVLDVSDFPKTSDTSQFLTDFANTLLKKQRTPVHLFLEECHDYLPQGGFRGQIDPHAAACVGAMKRLATKGRFRGIGYTLISQRAAEVNKTVLYQCETLIALRMVGDLDIKWIEGWVKRGSKRAPELLDTIHELADGECWVWSPGRLKVIERIQARRRETFDSGRTPEVGEARIVPKMAPVELEALKKELADLEEQAKADDPKTLRARIAELEKGLSVAEKVRPAPTKPEILVQPMFDNESFGELQKFLSGQVARVDEVNKQLRTVQQQFEGRVQELRMNVGGALATYRSKCMQKNGAKGGLGGTIRKAAESLKSIMPGGPDVEAAYVAGVNSYKKQNEKSNGSVSGGLRRMMIALAQRPNGLTSRQLGLRAGLSSKSGTFSTYLSRGRSEGWITDQGDKRLLTSDGAVVLGDDFESLPEGRELLEYWLKELGGGASRMLEALAAAYPNSLTNEELGAGAGISHKSGTFSTYLSRMRTLELVVGRGELKMSEELA